MLLVELNGLGGRVVPQSGGDKLICSLASSPSNNCEKGKNGINLLTDSFVVIEKYSVLEFIRVLTYSVLALDEKHSDTIVHVLVI